MQSDIIQGPTGDFFIPAEPAETRRICEGLSRGVWDGEYEHRFLPKSGVGRVLDIGAGWGAFAVWARKRFGESIELHCFEPHEAAADFCRMNDKQAILYREAVTVEITARLRKEIDWGCIRTFQNYDGEIVVPTLHPKDLPECDILKIDAEGVEPEILQWYPHLPSVIAAIYEWHVPEARIACATSCRNAGLTLASDIAGPWGFGQGVAVWMNESRIKLP